MTNIRATRRTLMAAATVLVFITLSALRPSAVQEQRLDGSQIASPPGHGMTGTWFMTTPFGLTGLYSFHPDGTYTGLVSNMAGAPPQGVGALTDGSPDHGIWRRVRGGVEASFLRFRFDPTTGDPLQVARVRSFFVFDSGRDSGSGTYLIDRWFCPTALTCPDPNTTPPDIANISPPPPANEFTLTRVRFP